MTDFVWRESKWFYKQLEFVSELTELLDKMSIYKNLLYSEITTNKMK